MRFEQNKSGTEEEYGQDKLPGVRKLKSYRNLEKDKGRQRQAYILIALAEHQGCHHSRGKSITGQNGIGIESA